MQYGRHQRDTEILISTEWRLFLNSRRTNHPPQDPQTSNQGEAFINNVCMRLCAIACVHAAVRAVWLIPFRPFVCADRILCYSGVTGCMRWEHVCVCVWGGRGKREWERVVVVVVVGCHCILKCHIDISTLKGNCLITLQCVYVGGSVCVMSQQLKKISLWYKQKHFCQII